MLLSGIMCTCDREQRNNPTVTLASGNSRNASCSSRDDKLWQEQAETEEDVLQLHWALD